MVKPKPRLVEFDKDTPRGEGREGNDYVKGQQRSMSPELAEEYVSQRLAHYIDEPVDEPAGTRSRAPRAKKESAEEPTE